MCADAPLAATPVLGSNQDNTTAAPREYNNYAYNYFVHFCMKCFAYMIVVEVHLYPLNHYLLTQNPSDLQLQLQKCTITLFIYHTRQSEKV